MRGLKMLLILLALILPLSASAQDAPGSADHPVLGRFDGAWIVSHNIKGFDAYVLPVGPISRGLDPEQISLEGRVFRIAYKQPGTASILEVARNFTNRLTEQGFKILFECEAKTCGGTDFRYGTEVLPIPRMDVNTSAFRFIAAHHPGGPGAPETHVSIIVTDVNREIRTQVIVVEREAMQDKMIDAKAMQEGIEAEGRIALYGIHFDTDSAQIKPSSLPALQQIAKLLQANPSLDVMIVGHTDSEGALAHNMNLSRRRAEAVVAALVADHGIARGRLTSAGVGYLSPVASNQTPDGRALNRRVELVQP